MKATIIQPEHVREIVHKIPRGMVQAAGLLKGKRIDGLTYQKRVRKEWEKRDVKNTLSAGTKSLSQ